MNSKTFRGIIGWTFINGLFMWAIVGACVLGSPMAYNFMAWLTGILAVITFMSWLGTTMAKKTSPEIYKDMCKECEGQFHVNMYLDILYDLVVVGLMVYGGFFAIVSIYAVTMYVQHDHESLLKG